MTRFARATKNNRKLPHDASSWQEMKSSSGSGNSREPQGAQGVDKANDKFNRKRSHQDSYHDNNQFDRWKKAERSEGRRIKRIHKRESVKVCFSCRKEGHRVADCPEKNKRQLMGICFKCGSTEHSINECKAKVGADEFPYAKCFICKETGHLSKQCPDNPRGLYPNGGCCKECGSVEHYRKDCPELQKEQGMVDITVSKLSNYYSADAEPSFEPEKPVKKVVKKGPKIVKF